MSAADDGSRALTEARRLLKAFDKTRFDELAGLVDDVLSNVEDAQAAFDTIANENDDLQFQVQELTK